MVRVVFAAVVFSIRVMRTRQFAAIVVVLGLLLAGWALWKVRSSSGASKSSASVASGQPKAAQTEARARTSDLSPTNVYAHNLMLRKGPDFRIYVRWLRGQMARSHKNVNPTFDDPDSFSLYIKTGVIRANIGDIGNYLNSGLDDAPLKNIQLSGDGDQVKLKGTVHKLVPLPIEMTGTLSTFGENGIQIHVNKLSVLKVPLKGMLGAFHVTLSDLFKVKNVPGLEVTENDIRFDTHDLLPPPHISGHLTRVHVVNPDLEEIYGDAKEDVERTEEWRNFLRLSGGSIDFGKLTMHNVDLIMIDISKDSWFDLDLANYQEQLVNGYTRMTPQAGLQIFMPDLRDIKNPKKSQNVSIEWLKNRNLPPPPDVVNK
ncbi:MAG: hypothetical protein ACJ746_32480 [Bryobacteraceae bacterium]